MPTIELQEWVTITGSTALAFRQEMEKSVDTSEYRTAVQQAMVLSACDCTLIVGGGDTLSMDDIDPATYTSGYSVPQMTYLSKDDPYGSSTCLPRFIGWRIEGGAAWKACFRLTLTLK